METVEIIIMGGAVQDVVLPRGVRVIIKDYDIDSEDEDSGFDIRRDKENDCYQHMEFVNEEDEAEETEKAEVEAGKQ